MQKGSKFYQVLFCFLLLPALAFAQGVTTASLNGTVRAPVFSVDGGALVTDNVETAYEVDELSEGDGESSVRAVA